MKNLYRWCVAGAMLAAGQGALAQLSYTTPGSVYGNTFDMLATSGTTNPWANDSTMPGWFAHQSLGTGSTGITHAAGRDTGGLGSSWATSVPSTYRADNGASNAGALWSWGSLVVGGPASTERAFGSIASGTPGDFVFALVLQNNTGVTLTSFILNFIGEQWRNGGTTALHTLEFDFAVFATAPGLAELRGDNVSGYTAPGAGWNFTSPVATATAGIVDGNAAGNRVALGGTQGIIWNPGEFLVLRWFDDDHSGGDHGLGIDDLSFRAVPGPSALALLGLGGIIAGRRRRN